MHCLALHHIICAHLEHIFLVLVDVVRNHVLDICQHDGFLYCIVRTKRLCPDKLDWRELHMSEMTLRTWSKGPLLSSEASGFEDMDKRTLVRCRLFTRFSLQHIDGHKDLAVGLDVNLSFRDCPELIVVAVVVFVVLKIATCINADCGDPSAYMGSRLMIGRVHHQFHCSLLFVIEEKCFRFIFW